MKTFGFLDRTTENVFLVCAGGDHKSLLKESLLRDLTDCPNGQLKNGFPRFGFAEDQLKVSIHAKQVQQSGKGHAFLFERTSKPSAYGGPEGMPLGEESEIADQAGVTS